ncbi:MATH/TRAF domain - like 7 [Theobroma cacao]|nr:MATH/TRAF domain - like 7 [Theobroma cacao]
MPTPDGAPKPSDTPNKEMKGLETWREVPPTHYILKIESFTSLVGILRKTGLDHYESNVFGASGRYWMLLLYPWEDKKRNGSHCISLYLKLVDYIKGENYKALVIFFVYDQLKGKYWSFQDTTVRTFHGMDESGVSQLVSPECFENASNGFLVNDSCVFGVEVFAIQSGNKVEHFRTLRKQSEKVYIWNVEKFSELKATGHFSEPFSVGGFKWRLHLYPRGIPKARGKYLSIYLCLHDESEPDPGSGQKKQDDSKGASGSGKKKQYNPQLPRGKKMHVEYKLSINNQGKDKKPEKISKRGYAWFSALDTAWGFPYFTNLDDPGWRRGGFIFQDALLIELQIISMSLDTAEAGDEMDIDFLRQIYEQRYFA